VVGCNLEDTDHRDKSLRDPAEQAAYLQAVKAAARAAGVDIVLNARIDIFVRRHTETPADIEEALQRARMYLDAGADCIYPILVHEERTIAALVEGIPSPINIYALADGPPLSRLIELGVKRISFAGRLQRELMASLAARLQAIRSGEA
jgi:2-methylisocitrate lyase-like PEP mutase family enzyme